MAQAYMRSGMWPSGGISPISYRLFSGAGPAFALATADMAALLFVVARSGCSVPQFMLRCNRNLFPGDSFHWPAKNRVCDDENRAKAVSSLGRMGNGRPRHHRRDREDTVVGVESIIIMLIVGAIAGWLA